MGDCSDRLGASVGSDRMCHLRDASEHFEQSQSDVGISGCMAADLDGVKGDDLLEGSLLGDHSNVVVALHRAGKLARDQCSNTDPR